MALVGLVHCTWLVRLAEGQARLDPPAGKRRARPGPAPGIIVGRSVGGLPPAVADMRSAILAAVDTSDIAELKGAMDLNELRPEFGAPAGVEPIAHLRSVSADGTGKDILALLGRMLDGGWAAIPGGRDIENNRIYVWPHFAEIPLDALGDADRSELAALVGEDMAKAIVATKRWVGWRLSIGADGVWHTFMRVGP